MSGDAPTAGTVRVLVVDDEPRVVETHARVIRELGYAVETVLSSQDALRRVREEEFDVVVSDLQMPGMDGQQLLRAVREHNLDLPVVIVTGSPSLESAIACLEYGALRYLVKPVDADQLKETTIRAAQLYQLARAKRTVLAQLGVDERQLGDRAGLEVGFQRALGQLFMLYQPVVSWSSRSVYAYEALVRSKEATLPHPGALFDAAERLGRLRELGRAIRAITPKPFEPRTDPPYLFMNLHPQDLLDDSLYVQDGPLSSIATSVVLEITERASLDEVKDLQRRVAQLREIGFRIAIDDIGAGYAGLTSFALLEPEVLKIDMSIVRGVDTNVTKQKLVRALSALSGDMGMLVIAEGVETPAERDKLVELGIDFLQGYLFGRPSPPFSTPTF